MRLAQRLTKVQGFHLVRQTLHAWSEQAKAWNHGTGSKPTPRETGQPLCDHATRTGLVPLEIDSPNPNLVELRVRIADQDSYKGYWLCVHRRRNSSTNGLDSQPESRAGPEPQGMSEAGSWVRLPAYSVYVNLATAAGSSLLATLSDSSPC